MAYRLFGSAGSPYSVKVRSYFRYKDLDHVWLIGNTKELAEEKSKHSKLPLVPTLVTPDKKGVQDSTPIMEMIEIAFPEPSVHPPGALRFLSELLEEFGDEWGNKWMMHMRWYSDKSGPTADWYSRRTATEQLSGVRQGTPKVQDHLNKVAEGFKKRMLGRGFTVGSNQHTAPIIEKSYADTLALLEAHLATRPFLFGRSPSMGDFGVAAQLYQCFQDLMPGEFMRLHAPRVAQWVERMVNPRPVLGGGFEEWSTLAGTLEPLLRSQVSMFLRWSDANARAVAAGSKEMSVDVGDGRIWKQDVGGPQKYHAKSLQEIRKKFVVASRSEGLVGILDRCGCLEFLQVDVGPSKL